MTKPTHRLHWDTNCESEPVSICASAVRVCVCACSEETQKVKPLRPEHLSSLTFLAHSCSAFPSLYLCSLDISWFGFTGVYFSFVCFPYCSAPVSYVGIPGHILAPAAARFALQYAFCDHGHSFCRPLQIIQLRFFYIRNISVGNQWCEATVVVDDYASTF